MYKTIIIDKGQGGWGTGFSLTPTTEKHKILSVTGGGIHPVAQRIAELSGGEAVDGFKNAIPENEILCAIIGFNNRKRGECWRMEGGEKIGGEMGLTGIALSVPFGLCRYSPRVHDKCFNYSAIVRFVT